MLIHRQTSSETNFLSNNKINVIELNLELFMFSLLVDAPQFEFGRVSTIEVNKGWYIF